MPTLYILAGPNGAGKTTFYFNAIKDGYINKSLPFRMSGRLNFSEGVVQISGQKISFYAIRIPDTNLDVIFFIKAGGGVKVTSLYKHAPNGIERNRSMLF